MIEGIAEPETITDTFLIIKKPQLIANCDLHYLNTFSKCLHEDEFIKNITR